MRILMSTTTKALSSDLTMSERSFLAFIAAAYYEGLDQQLLACGLRYSILDGWWAGPGSPGPICSPAGVAVGPAPDSVPVLTFSPR